MQLHEYVHKLIVCESKDYTVLEDGELVVIRGNILVGCFFVEHERLVFHGGLFSHEKNGYELIGDCELDEDQFRNRVRRFHEFKTGEVFV